MSAIRSFASLINVVFITLAFLSEANYLFYGLFFTYFIAQFVFALEQGLNEKTPFKKFGRYVPIINCFIAMLMTIFSLFLTMMSFNYPTIIQQYFPVISYIYLFLLFYYGGWEMYTFGKAFVNTIKEKVHNTTQPTQENTTTSQNKK